MNINIHAGHGKQDSKSCGAYTNLMKESVENRLVKNEMVMLMKKDNQNVYDCTIDYPASQSDCINKIVKACNTHNTDLDVSIHFNSGRNNIGGDGKIGGVEVILYDNSKNSPVVEAQRVCDAMTKLGFTNRGVKYNKNLGYLRDTKGRSMIIEVCFVDDKDDSNLYYKLGYRTIAKTLAEALLNKKLGVTVVEKNTIKIKINGKYYEVDGIFKDDTNYVKVRELEKAGFKIGYEGSVATVETPCCCK